MKLAELSAETLNVTDDIALDELSEFILELDMKGYIVEVAGRYTRKIGG